VSPRWGLKNIESLFFPGADATRLSFLTALRVWKKNVRGERWKGIMIMETCANCGRSIGNLEQHLVWQNNVVCLECNARLQKQAAFAEEGNKNRQPPADSGQTPTTETEDAVVFSGHPRMFRASPVAFVLCIIFIPLFGIGLICLLLWWLECNSTTLTITRQRIIYRTGIFTKNTNEVWHTDVRNVLVRQGPLQRLLNCGQIDISTAAQADVEISADGFENHQKLADYIREFRKARV
jgi:membrane protein YdbS with pleckstrin-like domain